MSDRQNSFLCSGFSRVSNCHRTRKGLAEYPDAPATQTISPFQSIRIRLTFCSASHERTSKEMLPLPSNKDNSLGQRQVAAKISDDFALLRVVRKSILDGQRAILNAQRHAMSGKRQCGRGLARLVRRADAFSTRARHMLERVAQARSSSSNSMSAGVGSAHCRGDCRYMTSAEFLAFIIGTNQGFCRRLNDNRIQFALPDVSAYFVGEGRFNSFWVEDFREARIVAP